MRPLWISESPPEVTRDSSNCLGGGGFQIGPSTVGLEPTDSEMDGSQINGYNGPPIYARKKVNKKISEQLHLTSEENTSQRQIKRKTKKGSPEDQGPPENLGLLTITIDARHLSLFRST